MASDVLGNLWFMDGAGASTPQTYYQDTTAFGVPSAIGGTEAGPFKFGGANGCQTDTGLVLMGHRYYDTRIGRFISQDPAGDGDNWYAYAEMIRWMRRTRVVLGSLSAMLPSAISVFKAIAP